jgi:hypothetical protein
MDSKSKSNNEANWCQHQYIDSERERERAARSFVPGTVLVLEVIQMLTPHSQIHLKLLIGGGFEFCSGGLEGRPQIVLVDTGLEDYSSYSLPI